MMMKSTILTTLCPILGLNPNSAYIIVQYFRYMCGEERLPQQVFSQVCFILALYMKDTGQHLPAIATTPVKTCTFARIRLSPFAQSPFACHSPHTLVILDIIESVQQCGQIHAQCFDASWGFLLRRTVFGLHVESTCLTVLTSHSECCPPPRMLLARLRMAQGPKLAGACLDYT